MLWPFHTAIMERRSFMDELRCLAPVVWVSNIFFGTPFAWWFTWYMFKTDVYLRVPIILYLAWILVGPGRKAAATGSWRPLLRRWRLFSHFADYFPARIHKTADLDPSKKYLFGFCPHGITSMSAWCAFATEGCGFSRIFPGIDLRIGTLRWNFITPIARELMLLLGFFDVERDHCLRLLSKPGRAILIAMGGAAEAVYTQPGCYDLVLRKRKGFVKVALKTGACLVPMIAFGENDLYTRVGMRRGSLAFRLQTLTKKVTGFTLPLAYGVGPFGLRLGLLPRRMPLNIVIGAPIEVAQYTGSLRSEEGKQLVDQHHQQYLDALQQLWDTHKDAFAKNRVRELCFVE